MSIEPIYIAQTSEPEHIQNRDKWFRKRMDEAKQKGAQLARFTIGCPILDGEVLLIECWKEKRVDDQGEPRWQLKLKADEQQSKEEG